MTKKIYMQPQTQLFRMNTTNTLMAGSITFDDSEESGTGQLIDENATSPSLVRHRSVWDEEEED